jgi:hypothetical protein
LRRFKIEFKSCAGNGTRLFYFSGINTWPMKKLLIFILFAFLTACDDEEKTPSKTELLTNGSSKSWNLTASSDTETDCPPDSERSKDNTWTFHADGNFTYDHGEITESETCGDLKNITGTWSFQEDETKLKIFAHHNTDDPDDVFNDELFTHPLVEITDSKFILNINGVYATFTPK